MIMVLFNMLIYKSNLILTDIILILQILMIVYIIPHF